MADGPFAKAKEVVSGFAILKANSKEEVIELARNFLTIAGDGQCELRQTYEANGAQQDLVSGHEAAAVAMRSQK